MLLIITLYSIKILLSIQCIYLLLIPLVQSYSNIHQYLKPFTYINKSTFTLYSNNIRIANKNDITPIAQLLSEDMYDINSIDDINQSLNSQKKELMRLEIEDLNKRYINQRRYPTTLLIAENKDKIITGVVGFDCKLYSSSKFNDYILKDIPNREINLKSDESIVVVLSNLVIKQENRKQGIAKQLILYGFDLIKNEWKYDYIFLQVEENNRKAIKLYKKLGFIEIAKDPNATCVAFGKSRLKTQPCVNVILKKDLKQNSFLNILQLFNRFN